MLTILIKWTKEIILGLYFLGTLCVLSILIKWTKEIILGLYFFGTIVCVNYIDQMDKRKNFLFILFRDHCLC